MLVSRIRNIRFSKNELTKRSISTRKSIIKRSNKDSAIDNNDSTNSNTSAKGKAILKMKKDNKDNKTSFIHDYSIFPENLQHRLPTEEEKGQPPKPHSNLIKLIFEQGGIESMDLNANYEKFSRYPLTNISKLNKRSTKPKSVKMLTSDFIDDSLYNVNYGYFTKEATIFQPDKPFDYNQLEGQDEFMQKWLQAYDKYDQEKIQSLQVIKRSNESSSNSSNSTNKKSSRTSTNTNTSKKTKSEEESKLEDYKIAKPSLQLWHTPTELFQPYYGDGLARYILSKFKEENPINGGEEKELIIYEIGAGNGTLMLNILDFLAKNEPEIYNRTKYRIIEISSKLFNKQNSRLDRHKSRVEVVNKSIFDWNTLIEDPCFVIALEVFDNLSHDVVRYDIDTKKPYQGYVVIDENNDFHEYYSPDIESSTKEFLKLRENSKFPIKSLKNHPLNQFYPLMKIKDMLNPMRVNLSDPEYIPTRLIKLFKILKEFFPNHKILTSDFSKFDKTIKGYNSPTVQTMYKDNMINTDTYMVDQGYFDIMFPTDFKVMNELYMEITGKKSFTCSHAEFLKQWADIEKTKTKSGENPMLDLYTNADFLHS